jgi:hypothetical protein
MVRNMSRRVNVSSHRFALMMQTRYGIAAGPKRPAVEFEIPVRRFK